MTLKACPPCPLCPTLSRTDGHNLALTGSAAPSFYHQDKARTYWHCSTCDLVFVPRQYHLSLADQKAIYDQHQNDPTDPGYQRFLSRFTEALLPHLDDHASGLDYGCGPGPALAQLLRPKHCQLDLYDPIYYPNPEALTRHYDFVTATEVVEHFSDTGKALTHLWARVAPGGWLGIMTKRVSNPDAFKTWHYIRDPTHLSFFSDQTFQWLAHCWQATLHLPAKDVALLQKPVASNVKD